MGNLGRNPIRVRWACAAAALLWQASAANASVLGLWRFNEGSGGAVDSSGNGNDGSLVGPFTTRSAGKPGFGSALDVQNDTVSRSFVQVPGSYSLGIGKTAGAPWSFTAWGYENDDGSGFIKANYGTIVLQNKTVPEAGTFYGLAMQSGGNGDEQMYLWHGENANWQIGTGVAPILKAWTHHAYVYDGSDFIYYMNGVEKYRKTVGAQDVNYTGYDGGLQIGGTDWFAADRNWDGKLDDVAVFNQALTPTQIATVMTGDFSSFISPLPPPPLVEWATTGYGDWNTKKNWSPIVAPNANTVTVKFGNQTLAPTTVVADQAETVKGLEFNHTMPFAIAGTGTLNVTAATGNGSITVVNAGGTVAHEIQIPVQLGSNTDVTAAAGTSLDFDNQLLLNGKTLNVSGAGRVNINNDGTAGTAGAVSNSGVLGGAGTIKGSLVDTAGGTLAVDISGTGAFGAQGLTVTGAATLGGTLAISLLNGFTPTNGNTFTVLTAASITTPGLTLSGASAGFSYSVVGGTSLVLTFGAGGTPGDYTGDGRIDGADFLAVQRGLGTTYTATDLAVVTSNFGVGGAVPATGAVPEPSSMFLSMLCGIVATAHGAGRRRRNAGQKDATSMAPSPRQTAAPRTERTTTLLWIIAFAVAASCLVLNQRVHATVLTFTGDYGGNLAVPGAYTPFANSYSIPDEYGDRVTGLTQNNIPSDDFGGTDWYNFSYGNSGEGFTPNVVVGYPTSSTGAQHPFRYWSSYGSLPDVAYPDSGDPGPSSWYVTLAADAGVNVTLQSLQLDRYTGTGSGNVTVSVHQGLDPLGTQLYSSGSVAVNAGTATTISPNVTGNALTLVYDFETGDANYNWATDNIRFSQTSPVIPTTATWALAGSGRWTKPGNWAPDFTPILLPNGNDKTAVLGNSTVAGSTVALDGDVSVKKLQFNHTQAYAIAGTGTLTLDANTGSAAIEVLNAGGSVTHQLNAKVQLADNTTVSLAAGTTLEFNNKLSIGAFNIVKSGAGTLKINNVVSSTGGGVSAVAGLVSGSGFIGGDFENSGATVSPGNSPGELTIDGDYVQDAGTLQIELAGTNRIAQYDVLNVGGSAQIDGGSLEVVLTGGFHPAAGATFDILDFASASGAFDSIKLPTGVVWNTSKLLVDGTISVVSAVPEPTSVALAAGALMVLGRRRRRS